MKGIVPLSQALVVNTLAVTAGDGYLTEWVVLREQPISLLDREMGYSVFPVEGQVPWLFPLLPLEVGYEAAIPHFSQWRGTEQWKRTRVKGSETLTISEKSLDSWLVDGGELFPGYRVTYWVDKNSQRIIQGVAGGGEGKPEYWSRAVLVYKPW